MPVAEQTVSPAVRISHSARASGIARTSFDLEGHNGIKSDAWKRSDSAKVERFKELLRAFCKLMLLPKCRFLPKPGMSGKHTYSHTGDTTSQILTFVNPKASMSRQYFSRT